MPKRLGFSVYVSHFDEQQAFLTQITGEDVYVFTSLHMSEEVSATYKEAVMSMCHWLKGKGFIVIGDVSRSSLSTFNVSSLEELQKLLQIDYFRLDDGFTQADVATSSLNFVFNASTERLVVDHLKAPICMHNFYPRPETGLDREQFKERNNILKQQGAKLLAFIPGDNKRGPLHLGLPTLEEHRYVPSYVSYLDLVKNEKLDYVFVGDVTLDLKQYQLIREFETTGRIQLPVNLNNKDLYHQSFTIRSDSPKSLLRLEESRQYAKSGPIIEPTATLSRPRGTITMDNKYYLRYSGEIQITRADFVQNHRVNVIGQIADDYLPLLDSIENGDMITFVPSEDLI
ncbi:hypothetical protein SAMN05421839_1298 [Halolactibacillus halophilus]|uniref:Outer surface protein n=1 Tax=Halolactibacillus halophilus TaxID=306540 RepID=A0A1I5REY3_9BACI|nr:MupG family TIM beta-alpha barrel fold protein [Halolactibacillus halophilus]GEM02184.1 outer surface protein [Halolactibacillus halophilus]SFP56506.1 hypothetical protein SAMN05421839_1298 [Halolactibacillus halophilus]